MRDFLEIGRIVKIHGLKGAVKVLSYLESDEVLLKLKNVYIRFKDNPEPFRVKKTKIQNKNFLLELEGVEGPEAAAGLVGREISMPSDQLEPLPEGEYYWRDLIGLEVSTEEGEHLGKISSIFSTGSNDVYVCSGKKTKSSYRPSPMLSARLI